MAAREDRLGLEIERAQQLAFPAVPGRRSHRADIGHGQDQQQLQALGRLHHIGEIENGLEVVEIAHLCGLAHQEMMADEPGHGFGLGCREAKSRAQGLRHPLAGDGMAFLASLGDVMEEDSDIENTAARYGRENLGRQRMV